MNTTTATTINTYTAITTNILNAPTTTTSTTTTVANAIGTRPEHNLHFTETKYILNLFFLNLINPFISRLPGMNISMYI